MKNCRIKRLMNILCVIVAYASTAGSIFWYMAGCGDGPRYDGKEYSAGGVLLHVTGEKNGWIKNTGDNVVSVKMVEKYRKSQPENTVWVKVIQPGEKLEVNCSGVEWEATELKDCGFYISNKDGMPVGYIRVGKISEDSDSSKK